MSDYLETIMKGLRDMLFSDTPTEEILQSIKSHKDIDPEIISRLKEMLKIPLYSSKVITVLNNLGFSFNSTNMVNLSLAGADLSNGIFISTKFDRSDLRDSKLSYSTLVNTSFANSNLLNVSFGACERISFPYTCLAFDVIGNYLILGCADSIIRVYNTETQKTTELIGHTGKVTKLKACSTSLLFVSLDDTNIIIVYNVKEALHKLQIMYPIWSIDISPQHVIIGTIGNRRFLWNYTDNDLIDLPSIKNSMCPSTVKFSPDKTAIAFNCAEEIYTCQTDTLEILSTSTIANPMVSCIEWSSDSRRLAVLTADKQHIFVINLPDSPSKVIVLENNACVLFYHGFLVIGSDSSVRILGLKENKPESLVIVEDSASSLLSNDIENIDLSLDLFPQKVTQIVNFKNLLASLSTDGTILFHELPQISTSKDNSFVISSIAVSSNSLYAAAHCTDGRLRMWNTNNNSAITLNGHSKKAPALSFTRDNSFLVSGGWDFHVMVWDVQTGTKQHQFTQDGSKISSVAVSNDSSVIAAGNSNRSVYIYSLVSGELVTDLLGHNKEVTSLSFSEDGAQLASVDLNFSIIIWNTQTWRQVKTIWNTTATLMNIKLIGKTLMAHAVQKPYIYSIEIETEMLSFLDNLHTQKINGIDASRRLLASAGEDRKVQIFKKLSLWKILYGFKSGVKFLSFSATSLLTAERSHLKLWNSNK